MLLQSFLVALLVAGSAVYVVWQLMPAGLRRALARTGLRWPALVRWGWLSRHLHAATREGSGCSACDRCGSADLQTSTHPGKHAAVATAAPQVITFHPRQP